MTKQQKNNRFFTDIQKAPVRVEHGAFCFISVLFPMKISTFAIQNSKKKFKKKKTIPLLCNNQLTGLRKEKIKLIFL